MGILYLISFGNGRRYLGISRGSLRRRRTLHLHHARKGRPGALQAAIRKYGEFEMLVLLVANDWNFLCEMERRAIAAFGTRAPGGYNLTDGGEGTVGRKMSTEQRARLSESRKGKLLGNKFALGFRHSLEAKIKISEANRIQIFSEERRAKIGASKIGNKYGAGRECSAETRQKISASQKGRPLSEEHRRNLLGKNKGKPWSEARRAAQRGR